MTVKHRLIQIHPDMTFSQINKFFFPFWVTDSYDIHENMHERLIARELLYVTRKV